MSLQLRNGKFYDGDKVVPLEFGNKEQIRLLRAAELKIEEDRRIEAMVKSGEIILAKPRFVHPYIKASITCRKCHSKIVFREFANSEDELEYLIDTVVKCQCGCVYGVAGTHNGLLVIERLN